LPIGEEGWHEETIQRVRIRVRDSEETYFQDPRLVSVIKGDVLPSVSRRDRRRGLADVWTSGNRVFGCSGRSTLKRILHALAHKQSPYGSVESWLQRPLSTRERHVITKVRAQVLEVVASERSEMERYGE
jgi:hypothetical protein